MFRELKDHELIKVSNYDFMIESLGFCETNMKGTLYSFLKKISFPIDSILKISHMSYRSVLEDEIRLNSCFGLDIMKHTASSCMRFSLFEFDIGFDQSLILMEKFIKAYLIAILFEKMLISYSSVGFILVPKISTQSIPICGNVLSTSIRKEVEFDITLEDDVFAMLNNRKYTLDDLSKMDKPFFIESFNKMIVPRNA